VIFDILWLQHRTRDEIMALVDVEGDDEMRAALAEGRGAIMATGHIGNWELSGVAFGWVFGPSGVVARPLDNPLLDQRLVAFRQKSGNAVIYKRQALSQTLRMVRDGKAVAFVVDQNVQADEGIFVDFFGRPAASTTAAAALAVRVGCPIFMGWADLRPSGRYTLHLWVIRPRAEGERQAEVERLTQELAHRIEGWVRSSPEQWLWLHRRWKTRPEKQQSAVSTQQSGTERATELGTEPGTEPGKQHSATRSAGEQLAPGTEPPSNQRGPRDNSKA
jgi:KDO2-lipid IV(A) lauroyltransferase